jgi:TonB family protein
MAINLADRDDATLLQPEVRSRMDRNQIQRLDTDRARASREDWRASREPMELTFVAVGKGSRAERRKASSSDPSSGARASAAPSRLGSTVGAEPRPQGIGEARRDPGGADEGGPVASPGLGLRDGRPGSDHRASADVMDARPMVAQGTPSIPSNDQGKPSDTTDSEQEVAAAMQSIVHASTAGGARGAGPGGQNGPGATGSGGVEGAGSKAKALGTGSGSGTDNDLRDTRRMMYLRKVMTKIHPLWANAFPHWAALEGLQGTAIVTFVLAADGSVTSATVSRPSGVPEFDENVRQAVVRGSPYGALPPELGSTFRWAMPFEARNPAVRPKDVVKVAEP